MRRVFHRFGYALSLVGYAVHHVDEAVDGVFALVFGRLYHHRLVEEQREVYRRGVVAVVKQPLRHVHGGHAGGLVLQSVEHELVHARGVDGQLVSVFQRFLYVVGVERGQRPHLLDVLPAQGEYVGVGTQQHGEVAVVWAYGYSRLAGQQFLKPLAHADRPSPGASASVGR